MELEVLKMGGFRLTSPAFPDRGKIPVKYTCKGDDVNPQLKIEGVPHGTNSLVLIMDDPDAPSGTWIHWTMWNIPPGESIGEDSVPGGAVQGKNSWGVNEYGGPCPPSGTHRYVFNLFAIDTTLDIDENSRKENVENAMRGHIIGQATLTGVFGET